MPLSRKIAYIDLSSGSIEKKPIPMSLIKKYVGGRGIAAYLLYNHTEPGIDPLSPDNPFIVSAGLIVGMIGSGTARVQVTTKSPLTGLLGSANAGGFFGPEMRWAGFDHLVIKGKAEKPSYIYIEDGRIEIRDASHLWGKGVYETISILKEELGEDVQVMCIGPAGENLVRFATVMTGRKNAAGRTGAGAVMGSKNLKAICVKGTMDLKVRYPKEAVEYAKGIIGKIVSTKVNNIMQRYGTMFIFNVTNSTGLVRVNNFRDNQLPFSEGLEPENIDDYSVGMEGCYGCQIHCRHRYVMNSGPYKGIIGEGPEYTSLGAFGAEVGCRSFELVLLGNHLVNDYGMDTLETGSMMAWAMELFEEGIITEEDTGGIKLNFGNEEAVVELVKMIAERRSIGDILAEGPLRAAEKIGKDSLKYLIHVKGMSNLHSDERPTPALALGIATSTRGADHLRSRPAIDLYNLPMKVLEKVYRNPYPYDGPLTNNYNEYEGKPWEVIWQEYCYMAVDQVGMCKYHTVFLSPNHPAFEEFSRLIYLNTGLELSPMDLWECAERAYNLERMFLVREGVSRKDDTLPDRYFDEPTPSGLPPAKGKRIDREKFEKMLDEYYSLHGWSEDGIPTEETLKRLGLSDEPSHIV